MIVKLLILIGLAWLLIRVHRYLIQPKDKQPISGDQTGSMVDCDTCHLHVPLDEAICKNGRYYCCRDHLPIP